MLNSSEEKREHQTYFENIYNGTLDEMNRILEKIKRNMKMCNLPNELVLVGH